MYYRYTIAFACLLATASLLRTQPAVAAPITISFSGVTGSCGVGPDCDDPPFRQDGGRAFTGSFTYDDFALPDGITVPAATVSAFSVTFPHAGLTLTATSATLYVQRHDAREQAVVVRGEFPNGPTEATRGFMSIGLISRELPPRSDLLSAQGITWDCAQWGQCGFRVGIAPASDPFVFPAGAIIARISDEPHNTLGSLTFQQPSAAAIPEPSTFVLVGLGLGGLAYLKSRRSI